MAVALPIHLGICEFKGADGRLVSFVPTGPIETRGDRTLLDVRSSKLVKRVGILSVRIFIPLSGRTLKEVVALVERSIIAPAPSFVFQKGHFSSERDAHAIDQDAVQVVFLDVKEDGLDRFRSEMQALGERIGKLLSGEWLYFELQSDGIARGFMTLSAW